MDFGVLGHITVVRDDGSSVRLPSASQRRLVGFLVSRANHITSVATIGLHLGLSDGAVRTGISRVRRCLGGTGSDLLTEGPGYVLTTDRIDHVRFELAVDAALADGVAAPDARRSLEAALHLWRGDAYAEFAREEWVAAEAVRLDELRATATEALVDILLAMGENDAALEHVATMIDRHPFRDRPRGQQMRALAATGRVTESLRAFHRYRAFLLDEVGTVPSPLLVELEQLIATGRVPAGGVRMSSAPPDRAPIPPPELALPHNFAYGLEGISREVASDLAECALLTLTGVGGIGKTRLAVTAAAHAARDFDRVVFVDLRTASSAEAVSAAAARALRVIATRSAVIHALRRSRTLVVLDSCEHVVPAVAGLVDEILTGSTSVRVLATSRHQLGVDGERVRHVPTLSPDDAMALFIDRASKWRDGFADDTLTRHQIIDICDRLDRIPLAVELAAACVAHMTLREIAAQLDDRLTVLPGDPVRLQQQRTLRATMDWSYALLDEDLRSLLRALSVFAVHFDAAAVSAVWGRGLADTLAGLGSLVRASLVMARPHGDETRYELLETVRLHAEDKACVANETERLRRAHADHYGGLLEAIGTVELLRPVSERRADIANHERLLEWVAAGPDLRRLGELAWRVAMAHRAECWTDHVGRYLGRDDIAAALPSEERSCYFAASFENANILGRWSDQLRFAELGLETATGPVRVSLLRGAANACNVLAPERVAALIDEAIARADPADIDVLLELRRTKVDTLLLAGDLDAGLIELRELWSEVLAAPMDRDKIRPLAGIDLLWVCIVLGLDGEASAVADVLVDLPGGEVAGRCAHAVVAARAERAAESAGQLLRAVEASAAEGVPLVENDVTVVAAVRALAVGDPERACRLLASTPGGARSPGSHQLLQHARGLVHETARSSNGSEPRPGTRIDPSSSRPSCEGCEPRSMIRRRCQTGVADDAAPCTGARFPAPPPTALVVEAQSVRICPVDDRCFDVTSTVQLDGPDGAFVLWVLFNTRRSKPTAECLAHWRDVHAPLARQHHGMCRYVQHVVKEPEEGGVEAIAELHFRTEADYTDRFYLHDDSRQAIADDVANFAGRLSETHFVHREPA